VGVATGVRARKCIEDARKSVARMINVRSSGKGWEQVIKLSIGKIISMVRYEYGILLIKKLFVVCSYYYCSMSVPVM